jgi:hypothetical protein
MALRINTNVASVFAQKHLSRFNQALRRPNGAIPMVGPNLLPSLSHIYKSCAESLVAAESRIRDVDSAAETADMRRSNVSQQAGISVISQATSSPQVAVQILQ